MRIIFLNLLLFLTISTVAQPSLSLRVFPGFSSNRVETNSDTLRISDDGSGLRLGASIVVDFPLTENYFFTTGVSYTAKKAGIVVFNRNTQQSSKQVLNIRYLQFPLTMKLYTNELSLDTKFYFQFGGMLEFKVGEKEKEGNADLINDFGFIDTSLLFAAGGEKKLGETTALYLGLVYTRGLIDVIKDTERFDGNLSMKNSIFGVEAGLRF